MRTTERDEYRNADIIGIESTTLYDGLDFEETARLTFALNRLADYEDTGTGMKNWFRIWCSNEKKVCRMIPETSANRTLDEAAAGWNMVPKKEAL